jgi:hypothetical protein
MIASSSFTNPEIFTFLNETFNDLVEIWQKLGSNSVTI